MTLIWRRLLVLAKSAFLNNVKLTSYVQRLRLRSLLVLRVSTSVFCARTYTLCGIRFTPWILIESPVKYASTSLSSLNRTHCTFTSFIYNVQKKWHFKLKLLHKRDCLWKLKHDFWRAQLWNIFVLSSLKYCFSLKTYVAHNHHASTHRKTKLKQMHFGKTCEHLLWSHSMKEKIERNLARIEY